jgi:haloalkane dehalogenase
MDANEFHSSRQFQQTPFGRIAYVERGVGPAALFLHGFPLNGFEWRGVLDDLAAERRCIAPDLMGLGYSEITDDGDLSFRAQARMLDAFLDGLGIDRVDLIGNDSGAGVSQVFAAFYPSRVRSLTLTNCEVSDLWPNAELQPLFDAMKSGVATEVMKAMVGDLAIAHTQLDGAYEDAGAITEQTLQTYYQPLLATDRRIEQFRRFLSIEVNRSQLVSIAPQLKQLQAPAQVIWGEADPLFDVGPSLDWLRRNLGRLEKVTVVPRARLFFPEEHPRLVSVLLREFWGEGDQRPSAQP